MKFYRFGIAALLAVVLALAGSQKAEAAFVLVIDDGADGVLDVIVVDDSPAGTPTQNAGLSTDADGFGGAGSILFSGTVGTWTVTVTTALSKPLVTEARVDLSVTVLGGAGTSILIGATDTDFTPGAGKAGLFSKVGGTTDGVVETRAEKDWVDQAGGVLSGNKEYSGSFISGAAPEPDAVVHQGPFTGGAFSGTASVSAVPTGSFSLTNYVLVYGHTGATSLTTLDHDVLCGPEPGSLLIFAGLPLVGGLWLRRRRQRSSN